MINLKSIKTSALTRVIALTISIVLFQAGCAQKQVAPDNSEVSPQVVSLTATSSPRTQSGFADELRFHQFETYKLSSPSEFNDPDISELMVLQFSAAVEEQMLMRGFTKDDEPDVLINIQADLKDMTSAPKYSISYASGSGVCPSYRFYNGGPRPVSSSGSRPTLCEFKEGMVKVNMVLSESGKAIWSGASSVRVGKKEAERNLVNQRSLLVPIVSDTNIMFENFPFRVIKEPESLSEDS